VNPNEWVERKKQFNAGLEADQAETQAILTGHAHIEIALVDEKMAGVIDDALIEPGNSWAERQSVIEELSGAVAAEVERRALMMKDAYPFTLGKGSSLNYRPSKTGVYEFCLAVARNPTGEMSGFPKASAIFEMLGRDVVASHLGRGAAGFRTGAPPYPFEDRGNSARDTFQALERLCGEFRWHPEHGFPEEPSFKDLKDAGVDLVVWKHSLDNRNGHLFVLCQCACGKNDVDSDKGRQLSIKRLEIWLRPVCHVSPLRCFLVAHHIPNTMSLYEISKDAGLVLDRARIALIAESSPEFMWSREGIDYHKMATKYACPEVVQPVLARQRQIAEGALHSQLHESVPRRTSRKTKKVRENPEEPHTLNN